MIATRSPTHRLPPSTPCWPNARADPATAVEEEESGQDRSDGSGPGPLERYDGYSSEVYSQESNWLCRPDVEDVCDDGLDATVVDVLERLGRIAQQVVQNLANPAGICREFRHRRIDMHRDDPEAIDLYQEMFEYFWEQAMPVDEADWVTAK